MKKEYRIKLFSNETICNQLAILAAKSNGGAYLSIEQMVNVIGAEKLVYPALNEGISYSIENATLIVKSGEKTALTIQEIEIHYITEQNGFGALAE